MGETESIQESSIYNIDQDKVTGTLTLTPKSGEWVRTVLFLHGLGDSTLDYYKFFLNEEKSPFPANYKVIMPQAESRYFTLMAGFPRTAWFNFNFHYSYPCEDQMQECATKMWEIIDKEVEYYTEKHGKEGAKERIICSGHSLGMMMSYYLGLTYPRPEYLAAIVGFSGEFIKTTVFDRIAHPDFVEGKNFDLP